jgi:hypothetical protein
VPTPLLLNSLLIVFKEAARPELKAVRPLTSLDIFLKYIKRFLPSLPYCPGLNMNNTMTNHGLPAAF